MIPTADPQAVVHWLTTAVQTRRTTPQRILRAASSRRFLRHRRLLEKIWPSMSQPEPAAHWSSDFLRLVERPHGLPVGHRQAARRGTEIDVLYKEYGLLIELDGRLGHDGCRPIPRHAARQSGDDRRSGHVALWVRRRAWHSVRGGHSRSPPSSPSAAGPAWPSGATTAAEPPECTDAWRSRPAISRDNSPRERIVYQVFALA